MAFEVLANLDCEARWAGVALPPHVLARISLYGALVAALAPRESDVEVWTPAAVDERRLVGPLRPRMRVGSPARPELAWADPGARAANDRRHALALAPLPGARVIESLAALVAHLAELRPRRWVCKAPWTSAGRDRAWGEGPALDPQLAARIGGLLRRFEQLVFEPWCDRLLDVGVCARVARDGTVTTRPPHGLLVDARGGFLGIDLTPPALTDDEAAQLAAAVRRAAAALGTLSYAGPFAVDAFAYRDDDGVRRFHPICEINARHTFGWVAHALADRIGATRLGFGPPPPGATVLVAPSTDDPTAAWCA